MKAKVACQLELYILNCIHLFEDLDENQAENELYGEVSALCGELELRPGQAEFALALGVALPFEVVGDGPLHALALVPGEQCPEE